MKINTKATGISLTPSISEYIEKKIQMLEKFFQKVDEVLVNVEVGKTTKHHKSGDVFLAEVQITSGGQSYYAKVETDDLYAAIDQVKDKLAYELSTDKKKAFHLFRRGGAKIKNILKGFSKKSK